MPSRYSEEEAVQKPAGRLLKSLGWELVYAWDEEILGENGTLGRTSYSQVVLRRYLLKALAEFNEWLEPERCEEAADKLLDVLVKYLAVRQGYVCQRGQGHGRPHAGLGTAVLG